MTPTQADRDLIAMVCRACGYDRDAFAIEEGKADNGWKEEFSAIQAIRLAAEAAAFEKAAGVFRECVVQQARDVAIRPVSPQSPGQWRDAVRQAAIRNLAGEKA